MDAPIDPAFDLTPHITPLIVEPHADVKLNVVP